MRFRNKNILVLFMLLIIILGGITFTNVNIIYTNEDNTKIKIVTSFYPMYIATLNLVSNIDDIELINLTKPQTGCLHDYQLTPQDMIQLETADIFIINGGGMENFIQDIISKYPNMIIINASENTTFLKSENHDHFDENHEHFDEEGHEHDEYNPHIWLNISKHIQQIKNIQTGLSNFDNKNKEIYLKNADLYTSQLENLKKDIEKQLQTIKNKDVIIFHDSFAYLAQEFNFDVKHTVVMESDTSLSAGKIAEVIDKINKYDIKILFTEEQYSTQIASSVASETNAKVYILDSCVNGKMEKDAYINAMKKNLKTLKGVLTK